MTRTRPAGVAIANALTLAILLAVTGCTGPAGAPEPAAVTQPSPATAAMRLDKPTKLLDTWTESVDRVLHGQAQQNMGNFKKLLAGAPTSAVGTAYVRAEEVYSRDLGLHIPGDDQRVILVSGVSGTITDPDATLDKLFTGLPNVTAVTPIAPGPLGGAARCGVGRTETGIRGDVCVWVDQHTLALVTFLGFKQTDNPHELFGQIRAEVEHPAR
ncbi:hypothetical protein V6V47_00180 [Micromonospora sp. CPCC 205539]|uniref:hypothetical protein n=1 Tax=Micromonospora sp. CPCC 205539 TaxID=3122408 RepID=UPI002FF1AFFF